ncbi:leucine-rich repeat-containing protein 58 [Sabethes cyaneus]|uniref:leucine-rich repeat-containing protein 58 n=1 Tax=Sabethes cyaneus TaxID=53552 RepID=UPI00221E2C26|nr:leucine-rich repeat-containing protein 58 [Sabethes cyaneus]XP_053693768.1 leucine-rich repeat-containing protein 58 [Sabethes cyaneus]XP_053693769.1 leucine-rich repeat-containing protein 58 [Sabethes cyaneus]XP_053693770.1 leucine-rich repeat-containing protein 58 [Sabethes cyaneus]XP_053693771.1 leucine-rich repeat-containing protein 58 [Sabethes cyaneus]
MDVTYTSDSCDSDSREQKTVDFGHANKRHLDEDLMRMCKTKKLVEDIETVLLNHNNLSVVPTSIVEFGNLRLLDLSNNNLAQIPAVITEQCQLTTLIVKNNRLSNSSLPKTFLALNNGGCSGLKELNLSGNRFTHFPEQVTELKALKYLYLGGNQITNVSKDIWKLSSLQLLSLGGNLITEIPETVGLLNNLHALVLCDNLLEALPSSIARLVHLKSLLLHKNHLKHLPREIITLKNLTELSLRDNPLVVRFVKDMTLNPPTLLELAARTVKTASVPYSPFDLPRVLIEYLQTANCCVNPNCKGVFFDNRVEHIKFVDFCGKYRIPLLQYLCSSKCVADTNSSDQHGEPSSSMMRKVLLG